MLVKCEECGGQVSDRAVACPHCGAPYTAYDNRTGLRRDGSALRTNLRDLQIPFWSLIWLTIELLPAMIIFALILSALLGARFDTLLEPLRKL